MTALLALYPWLRPDDFWRLTPPELEALFEWAQPARREVSAEEQRRAAWAALNP